MAMQGNSMICSEGEGVGCREGRVDGWQERNSNVEKLTTGYEGHSIF